MQLQIIVIHLSQRYGKYITKYNMKSKISIPYGLIPEVANRSGVHRATVERVRDGKSRNMRVLKTIAEVLTEYQSAREQITRTSRKIAG